MILWPVHNLGCTCVAQVNHWTLKVCRTQQIKYTKANRLIVITQWHEIPHCTVCSLKNCSDNNEFGTVYAEVHFICD